MNAMRAGILTQFQRATRPGERVLMLPSSNDFLSLVLAPFSGVTTYNAAGDKNLAAVKAAWPATVAAAVRGFPAAGDETNRLLSVLKNNADVIVISDVDLMKSGQNYPTMNTNTAQLRKVVTQLGADPRLDVHDNGLIATVRLRR